MPDDRELFIQGKAVDAIHWPGGICQLPDGTLFDWYAVTGRMDAFTQEVMKALPGVTAQEVIEAVREKRARHGGSSVP